MAKPGLKKRRWVYVQRPKLYEIAGCVCGNNDPDWSEYGNHLWCARCKLDFVPKHWGIFDGPVGVQACELLGIYFDRINLSVRRAGEMIGSDEVLKALNDTTGLPTGRYAQERLDSPEKMATQTSEIGQTAPDSQAVEDRKKCKGKVRELHKVSSAPPAEAAPAKYANTQSLCTECGRENPVWFAPNELWNRVIPERVAMLCPICFIKRAEKAGVVCTGWELRPAKPEGER